MVTAQSGQAWLSFQARFKKIAQQHPDRTALVDQRRARTYRELDEETSALSLELQRRAIARDDLVVLFMPSSYDYVASCVATLKAGAAFLPVPVDLPSAQVALIIEDASPKVLLTSERHAPQLLELDPELGDRLLILSEERLKTLTQHHDLTNPSATRAGRPTDLAFATYTSGTTGKPKGVLQVQGALVASYDGRHAFNPYGPGERVACNVFFMWEVLRPLFVGATTIVIPDELLAMPKRLVEFLRAQEATEVLFTPSAFQRLIRSVPSERLQSSLSGLRTLWLNGEVVTAKLVEEASRVLPPALKLLNTYSICECHDVSNADLKALSLPEVTQRSSGICPVGYADEGVTVRVMTERGLQAQGEGELYIGGHGLGAGYLHLDTLTQERFPEVDGVRYYATGDLSHLDPDGLITIKGRLGTMVKMRGYSVYLNSIEEALRLHPLISEARVFLRGEHLSQHLTAFIVGSEGELLEWVDEASQSAPQLRAWLGKHLAPYMIPSKWVRVDQLPVHPISGKLDQQALWTLERVDTLSLEVLSRASQASWADCVLLMRQLWARALEVDLERVDLESDFYELGGHSLSMVDLVMSVEEVFGVQLEGDELYEEPQLSAYLSRALRTHHAHPGPSSLPTPVVEPPLQAEFWATGDLDLQWPAGSLVTGGQELSALQVTRTRLSEARAVLLTGGTGHLGLGLLEGLIARLSPEVKLYCLARSSQGRTASERLIARYARAGLGSLHEPIHSGRLQVIEGDICDPLLGLKADHYHALSVEVDLILHCAALVNLRARYEQTKPSIVEGTRHVLHFAGRGRLKTLHHVSTNSVLAGGGAEHLEEHVERQPSELLIDGYSQAKWIAERLVDQASAQGIPTTVYRPGNIGPHQKTGYFNPNDLLILLLGACARAKLAPAETGWAFELTPVDVTAGLLLSLADLSEPQPRYHLVHPHRLDLDELFTTLRASERCHAEALDWRAWRSALLASDAPSDKVLASSLPYFNAQLTQHERYALTHLMADLGEQAQYFNQPVDLRSLLAGLWPRLAQQHS